MISIVIPTYNEASTIKNTLGVLIANIERGDEIIVVDGGSEDDTLKLVREFRGVKILESPSRGRAVQMNLGAENSTGDYILFIHADTTVDSEGMAELRSEISLNKINWGWFTLKLNSPKFIYRILEKLACYRTLIAHEPLGDHGIFVKRKVFNGVGGYPEIPIMEDIELVKRLKKVSPGKRINHFVLSSVRRFERGGILKTALNICMMRVAYFFGKSPHSLSRRYLNIR